MDDFLDNVFLSSPWPDINRSSWVGGTAAQTNELLADQVGGLYEGSERNIDLRTIPPNHIIGSAGELRHDSTSILNGGNSIYNLRKGFFHGVPQLQQEDLDHVSVPSGHDNVPKESKLSLQGYIEDNSRIGSLAIQLNTLPPVTLPQRSPGMPPGMPGSVGLNVNDASGLQQSLMASTSIAPLWDSPYTGVSIPSTIMGQGKLQGFGSRGEFGGSEAAILENKLQQPNSLASASDQMQDPSLPFAGASLMTLTRAAGMQHQQQLSQTVDANSLNYYTNHSVSQLQSPPQPASAGCAAAAAAVSCNGSAKPRVRARRGQATDPHSIAERLRREKIAERMKNLQELVPNSNKTDKASMLDEIIEYVKFLQLQVKVLSMSRLGAAGAVVPLITDVQSEGSNSLLLSASVGQGPDLSDSPDNIAFEQEVVKLMESNVTSAMQFLQTKSLCLMPIALAAAISGGKSSTNTFSCDRKKPTLPPDIVSPNGSFTSLGAHPPSSSESATHNENRDDASINGCTETIKQEEVYQSASNIRGSKPNA